MSRLWIPAIHLPHGKEVFKPFGHRPSIFKRLLKSYAQRFLLQCEPGDAICLPAMPDPDYLEFLLALGLGTEDIICCEGDSANFAADCLSDAKTMREITRRAELLTPASFYIHLEEEREIARLAGREGAVMHPGLTRMFNTTYFLIRLEEELQVNSIRRYQIRSGRFREPVQALLEKHGPLFIRGNESIAGSQVYLVKTREDVEKVHKKIHRNTQITRYFASRLLEPQQSWNCQYDLSRDGFSLYGASAQLWENHAHTGNLAGGDPPREVLHCAGKVVQRIWEMGAAGIFGIDLIMADGAAYPVEINARHNTSTPLIAVLRKLAGENNNERIWFHSFTIGVGRDFTFRSFAELVGNDKLLTVSGKTGFLPYHIDSCRITGVLDVAAFSDDPRRLERMVKSLKESI